MNQAIKWSVACPLISFNSLNKKYWKWLTSQYNEQKDKVE